MSLLTKQKQTHRHKKQTVVTKKERRWGRDKLGVWDQEVQTTVHKIDKQQGPIVQHRKIYSITCNKTHEKIYSIYITESLCYTPEMKIL